MKNDGMDCHVALWAPRNDGCREWRQCEDETKTSLRGAERRGNPLLQ